ncbi:MAG TPA: hypothetical protein VGG39_01275 [Polyangiaceae bacterium]
MGPTRLFVRLAQTALVAAAVACGNVPDDPGARIFAPAGVIQGTVLYQGPHPCSSNGHIVGNAILLVFDRRNPPPPNGLATLPANFADVTGDTLFKNEPRYTGTDVYCPLQHGFTDTITVSAPFSVSPLGTTLPDGTIQGASYEIEGFFDYTGDFLPTFKIRELPEATDIGGGDLDTADALKPINQGNPNYQPHFLPVNVGNPEPLQAGQTIPTYDIPSSGYLTSNVVVSMGQALTLTRPYLYPQGMTVTQSPSDGSLTTAVVQSSDCPLGDPGSGNPDTCQVQNSTGSTIPNTVETSADFMPVLTIPADIGALSAPAVTISTASAQDANTFEAILPHLTLKFGVAPPEVAAAVATGPTDPFHFQLNPTGPEGSFSVWQNQYFDPGMQKWLPLTIPEGVIPMLWPEVILSKLVDSTPPLHDGTNGGPIDPASLTAQGAAGQPVVIMEGITFLTAQQNNPLGGQGQSDTLFNTVLGQGISSLSSFTPGADDTLVNADGTPHVFQQDHLVIGLRPAVICFNHLFDTPPAIDPRGVIVTPQSGAPQATFAGGGNVNPVIPADLLTNADQPQTAPLGSSPSTLTGVQTRGQVTNLVNGVMYGCLPQGRYAINVVYPDGQAWTVPNEAGACSGAEGTTPYNGVTQGLTCTIKPRPVLYSQGNRAVVEIVAPTNAQNCVTANPETVYGTSSNPIAADNMPANTAAYATPQECKVTTP